MSFATFSSATRLTTLTTILAAATTLGAGSASAALGDLRLRGGCTIDQNQGWPQYVGFDLDVVSHPTFRHEEEPVTTAGEISVRSVVASFYEVGQGVDRHLEARVAVEIDALYQWVPTAVLAETIDTAAALGKTLELDYDAVAPAVHCAATIVEAPTTAYHDPYVAAPLAVETARVEVGVTLPTLEACALEIAFSPEGRLRKLQALLALLETTSAMNRRPLPFVVDEDRGTLTATFTQRAWDDRVIIEAPSRKSLAFLIDQVLYTPATTDERAMLRLIACP